MSQAAVYEGDFYVETNLQILIPEVGVHLKQI